MSEKMNYSQPHLFPLGDDGESSYGAVCYTTGYSAAGLCENGIGANIDGCYTGTSAVGDCNTGTSPQTGVCYDGTGGSTPE
jgi:hypothetical protein